MQTNRARFHRTLDFIGFFAFHTATNIVGGCIFGSRQPSLRKDRACPRYRVAPLARQSLTRFENIKSLSSCFKRGRRIARIGTQREANALCVSSAKCRLFEISYVSLDDCFAALQIVYPLCGGRRISPRLIVLTVYGLVPFIVSFHDLRLVSGWLRSSAMRISSKSKYMRRVDRDTGSPFLPPVYRNSCSSEENSG